MSAVRERVAAVAVAAASLAGFLAFAATPLPPTLVCDSVQTCIIEATYDLGELPAFVSDVQWPTEPTFWQGAFAHDTDGDGVDDASLWVGPGGPTAWDHGWEDATMTGRRMVVIPGTYDVDLQLACTDCEVHAVGVTFNGDVEFAGQRMRWTGGTINGGITNAGATDVLLNNVHQVHTNPAIVNNYTGLASDGIKRWAIINSTLEVQGGDPAGDWVMFVQPEFNGAPLDHQDFILANVRLESDAQLVRFQGIENLVVVDSYFNSNNVAANGLRIHQEARDVYFRDTIIVGLAISQTSATGIIGGLFERVPRYYDVNNHWLLPMNDVVNVTINDSDCYTAAAEPNLGQPCDLGQATGTNNTYLDWDGVTLPTPAAFRAGIGKVGPMGADH